MSEWHAYVAGFFDGEGSISIARVRANGLSDYHKIIVRVAQRAKHREVLDRMQAEFGGSVMVRAERTRVTQAWADRADWQLQAKAQVQRFLGAIQPYVVVKAPQVALALEFLETFQGAPNIRDTLGRVRGRALEIAEIERRERLRLAMRELNVMGPPRVKPSTLPPLDLQHRQRPAVETVGNPATVERGEQRYNARLTDAQVRAIRAEFAAGGVTKRALALRYGVTDMVIGGIVRGTRWAHVT